MVLTHYTTKVHLRIPKNCHINQLSYYPIGTEIKTLLRHLGEVMPIRGKKVSWRIYHTPKVRCFRKNLSPVRMNETPSRVELKSVRNEQRGRRCFLFYDAEVFCPELFHFLWRQRVVALGMLKLNTCTHLCTQQYDCERGCDLNRSMCFGSPKQQLFNDSKCTTAFVTLTSTMSDPVCSIQPSLLLPSLPSTHLQLKNRLNKFPLKVPPAL